jgi:hypothetical protein
MGRGSLKHPRRGHYDVTVPDNAHLRRAGAIMGVGPRPARSTAICRAGTCPTCSSWVPRPSRRTPGIIPRILWARSVLGGRRDRKPLPEESGPARADLSQHPRYWHENAQSDDSCARGLRDRPTAARAAEDNQAFEKIERGRYLAVLGDCVGCHTAPGGKPLPAALRWRRHSERWSVQILRRMLRPGSVPGPIGSLAGDA